MAQRDGQKSSERRIMQVQLQLSVVPLFFPDDPFLQGASHSGKTTFAKHLARLTGASVVSLDLLKMGLIKSGNTDFSGLTPEDDAAIAERLWPIVREMALVADENEQSLIVEGVSLPFGEAGGLARELGEGRAAAFAVVFSENTSATTTNSSVRRQAHPNVVCIRILRHWPICCQTMPRFEAMP